MPTTVTPRLRRPAVAGYYYPEDPLVLRESLTRLFPPSTEKIPARAMILPHGSLKQSGRVAAATLGKVRIPARCVILGPSHTNSAMRWELMPNGAYQTPLGAVPVDETLCQTLMECCPFLEADAWAQRGEHAIEVVLPFLQMARPEGFSIVPIVTSSDAEEEFAALAQALAQVITAQEDEVLLIASSDLSRYEEAASGAEKDRHLLEAIVDLNGSALVRQIHSGCAAMCGYGPAACVVMAAAQLGATKGDVVSYTTSVEADGDPHSTVGYAGIIIR